MIALENLEGKSFRAVEESFPFHLRKAVRMHIFKLLNDDQLRFDNNLKFKVVNDWA